MLVQRTTSRTLGGVGLMALLGAGAFLLPVLPARAQQPPAAEPIRFRVVGEEDAVKARVNDASVERLTAELAKKKAELAQLEARLKAAQGGQAGGKEVIVWRIVGGKAVAAKPGEQPKVVLELKDAQIQLDPKAKPEDVKAHKAQLEEAQKRLATLLVDLQNQQRPLVIEVTVDGKKKVIELPPGSRVINPGEQNKVPPLPVKPPAGYEVTPRTGGSAPPPATAWEVQRIIPTAPQTAPGDTDKRVAEIEKKLAEIIRELEGLRKELKANPASRPLPAVPYPPVAPPAIERYEVPRSK